MSLIKLCLSWPFCLLEVSSSLVSILITENYSNMKILKGVFFSCYFNPVVSNWRWSCPKGPLAKTGDISAVTTTGATGIEGLRPELLLNIPEFTRWPHDKKTLSYPKCQWYLFWAIFLSHLSWFDLIHRIVCIPTSKQRTKQLTYLHYISSLSSRPLDFSLYLVFAFDGFTEASELNLILSKFLFIFQLNKWS